VCGEGRNGGTVSCKGKRLERWDVREAERKGERG